MADDTIPAIAFDNQLAYDVIVYDSFDYDNDDSSGSATDTNGQPSSQTYFATLTQLGKVPAGTTVNIQPIHDSSAFVLESASDSKPIKRFVALSFEDITSFSLSKDDEAAMAQTFQFVAFFLTNPNDPMSVAFNKVLNAATDDLAGDIDSFFQNQPAYSKCGFEDYMMALAYSALHPPASDPSQPAGTSSLKMISNLMGSKWPTSLSDIFVTKFTCAFKDKKLVLTFEVDISTLPFETAQIASNVLSILSGTKVKAQISFNFEIGLNIFGTRLSLMLDALRIPIGDSKTLSIKKPEVSIDINPLFKFVVFTIKAMFPFNVNGKTFDAIASFVIDNEEAAIGVDIQGDNSSLPPPKGIKGLHFDEFGVGMGLFFKPPGFALGLLGKFHIGEPNGTNVVSLNDNTFALVCEYVEEVVEPKYIAFSVPQLSLNQVVELFTDINPKIDVPVNFTNLSFHWSDGLMDAVVLPDGTLSAGGYGFTAAVNIFSFGFYGQANLDINTGLTANVEVSPINLKNVFKLTGDGKGYSLKVDNNGNPIPNNFVPKTQAEKDAVANATSKQIVTAGGPCLIINTLSMPILHLNAKASLFDIAEYAIQADVNKSGITFMLDYGIVLKEKMTVTLSDFHNLAGSFTYYIDQNITVPPVAGMRLGSFQLKADVKTHFAIVTSLSDVKLSVGGSFDAEGLSRSFGDFDADIHIQKITDFLEAIGKYIEQEAKNIFSNFLTDAHKWAEYTKAGILTAFDEVGTVLKNVWNADSIAVASIMKEAGYALDDISRNIKNAWNCATSDVTYALKAVGYTANEVVVSLKNVFNADSRDVASALKQMGYTANEVGDAIKNAWNCGINDVAWAMQWVGFSASEVGGAVQHTFYAGAQEATDYLKYLSYTANEIGIMIKDVFGGDSASVAKVMKAANYAAGEVAGAIKNAWNCGVNDVTWAMQQVGYAANEICSALKDSFNAAAQDVANSFKTFGIAAQDTANAVKNVYNLTINDTASVLKNAGYATDDVASALKTAFNTSVDAVADAMKQVGYAANDVKNAFDELGGDFKSAADEISNDAKHYLNPSNW